MEGDYRLVPGFLARRRHAGGRTGVLVRRAPVLVLAGLIAASCPSFAGDETDAGVDVKSEREAPMIESGLAGRFGHAGVDAEGVEGAEGAEGPEGTEGTGRQVSETSGTLPLIVTLRIDEGTEAERGDDPVAAVTARVMMRLEAVMPAKDLAAVRTFSVLPIIALSADRDLIFELLAMPEVVSVERDSEFRMPGEEASALELPAVEPELRLEPSGEPELILDPNVE